MAETDPTTPTTPTPNTRFVFPRWTNYVLLILVVGGAGGALYAPVLAGLGFSPKTTSVGYAPVQPVQFSHAQHAGQLGIDCRYCHIGVDKGPHSTIPPTQTCMNCHVSIKPESVKLQPVRDSWASGKPVPWQRIHDLPDFVFFNHSAHVNRGVSCVECHGRVDQMDVVAQAQPLSMGWCLDCHRQPEKRLRPLDQITNLGWRPPAGEEGNALAKQLKSEFKIRDANYMQACSTCHR
ncbi:MAG TPA: cytochrome c3 family protein [Tepidisphaeraceae bacterium]|nr:cytochrome c3 family protein [Tepidisphaeraceae bacterium]